MPTIIHSTQTHTPISAPRDADVVVVAVVVVMPVQMLLDLYHHHHLTDFQLQLFHTIPTLTIILYSLQLRSALRKPLSMRNVESNRLLTRHLVLPYKTQEWHHRLIINNITMVLRLFRPFNQFVVRHRLSPRSPPLTRRRRASRRPPRRRPGRRRPCRLPHLYQHLFLPPTRSRRFRRRRQGRAPHIRSSP